MKNKHTDVPSASPSTSPEKKKQRMSAPAASKSAPAKEKIPPQSPYLPAKPGLKFLGFKKHADDSDFIDFEKIKANRQASLKKQQSKPAVVAKFPSKAQNPRKKQPGRWKSQDVSDLIKVYCHFGGPKYPNWDKISRHPDIIGMGRSLNALQTKIKNLKKEARQIQALKHKNSLNLTGPEIQLLKSKKKYLEVISDNESSSGSDCPEDNVEGETGDEYEENYEEDDDHDNNDNDQDDDILDTDAVEPIEVAEFPADNNDTDQEEVEPVLDKDSDVTGNRRITSFFRPVPKGIVDLVPDSEDLVPVSSLKSTTISDIKKEQEKIASARNIRNQAINEKILEKKEVIKHVKENSAAQEKTRQQVLNASNKLVELAENVSKKDDLKDVFGVVLQQQHQQIQLVQNQLQQMQQQMQQQNFFMQQMMMLTLQGKPIKPFNLQQPFTEENAGNQTSKEKSDVVVDENDLSDSNNITTNSNNNSNNNNSSNNTITINSNNNACNDK